MHIVISQHTKGQCVTTTFLTITSSQFQPVLVDELKTFFRLEKLGLATLQKHKDTLTLRIESIRSPRRFSLSIANQNVGLLEINSVWKATGWFNSQGDLHIEMQDNLKKDANIPSQKTKVFPSIDLV